MFDKVLFGLVRLPIGALIVESLTTHLSNDETHRCMEGWAVPLSLLCSLDTSSVVRSIS